VQALEALCPRLAGLQLSELTCSAAARLTLVVAEALLRVAVSVAV
jgi:hypothetical protein